MAFAVFALASVPLWRRFAPQVAPSDQAPMLNRRTEALVGRIFTLEKPIVDGIGTVRIDDTIWRVHGAEPLGQPLAFRDAVEVGDVDDPLGLLRDRLDHLRMGMAQRVDCHT